jgi:hypothetical protein
MAHHLAAHNCLKLCTLIDKALIVERSRLEYVESGSKKKRTDQAGRSSLSQRQRTGFPQGQQSQSRHYTT